MIDKFMHGFLNRVYGYDDYTQLEINSKLIQKMDEVIDNCNDAYEYLDWLKGQGLSDIVIGILLAWKDDGTLDALINGYVFNELNSKVDNFQENVNNELQTKKLELDNIIKGMNRCTELHYINNIADESSVLFKCMNGETVLVDCGESFSSGGVYNRLIALGVTKINHFINTHFHSDHVGGYNMIFDNFIVDNVYYKPITWTLSAKEIGWNT